jgi:Predicted periplasmic or secreted lipoprotein
MNSYSSEELINKVRDALNKQAEAIRGADIFVSAEGGDITLKGVVDSQKEKEKAIEIAKSVGGVSSVKDAFRVMAEQPDTGVKGPSPAYDMSTDNQGCSPSGRVG